MGDRVLTASGELKEITSIERESLEEPVPAYNFEVKDWHTYYVSGEEILVHNAYSTPGGANVNKANGKGGSNTWTSDKRIYSVLYEIELPSNMYPNVSDAKHFQEANKQLHEAFVKDPAFAQAMETLYPGIIDGVKPGSRGAYPRKPPTPDVTWHHEPN